MTPTLTGRQLYRRAVRGKVAIVAALPVLIVVVFIINVATGSSDASLADALIVLTGGDADPMVATVILDIRVPMALMAIVVGAALSIGGCGMQTILRNPMASPFTLGISAAASFGAALGFILEANVIRLPGAAMVTGNAFAFALLAAAIIYLLSLRPGTDKGMIVLLGIALNFLFNALTMLLQYIADEDELQSLVFWTFGSLLKTTWQKVAIVSAVLAVASAIYFRNSWKLTALSLDDHKAKSLGVNVEALRRLVIITVSVLAAAAVAFVGTIGFVGLVAPHIARGLVGEDQRFFMPASALIGAAILSLAFLVSKLVVPGTILPVGLVTAFVGIPFFIVIIVSRRGLA
ncbi:MAG: iron ABC transporter permease [Propionibacterium sp.]|nr:iron ABC transporter permease [Propionibacterium sp.]